MTGQTRVTPCLSRRAFDCDRGLVVFGIERNATAEGAPATQNTENHEKVCVRDSGGVRFRFVVISNGMVVIGLMFVWTEARKRIIGNPASKCNLVTHHDDAPVRG